MTKQEIYKGLQTKGFSDRDSKVLADNLISIDKRLQSHLLKWLEEGVESNFESNGMSISSLMDERNLQYQAALLTMDWIIKDPKVAIAVIKKGVR